MFSRQDIKARGVYFCFEEDQFHSRTTHYASACLAAGLRALKIPVFSNLEHPLFVPKRIDRFNNEIFILQITDFNYSTELMTDFMIFPAEHKILLSMSDANNDAIFTPPLILSLMTHENRFLRVEGLRKPWAFGLSDLILQSTENDIPLAKRKKTLLRNFRPSINQGVRDCLDLCLLPHLEKYFEIDWQISAEDHFTKLKNYFGCLAYGGHFTTNFMRNDFFVNQEDYRKLYERLTFLQEPVITRWDSWRFWESLAAGCLTFHLDFEKYGFQLPVMPSGWKHYIPIDLADPKGTVEQLMDRMDELPEIAAQGRAWARQHYKPEAVAQRFLSYMIAAI